MDNFDRNLTEILESTQGDEVTLIEWMEFEDDFTPKYVLTDGIVKKTGGDSVILETLLAVGYRTRKIEDPVSINHIFGIFFKDLFELDEYEQFEMIRGENGSRKCAVLHSGNLVPCYPCIEGGLKESDGMIQVSLPLVYSEEMKKGMAIREEELALFQKGILRPEALSHLREPTDLNYLSLYFTGEPYTNTPQLRLIQGEDE